MEAHDTLSFSELTVWQPSLTQVMVKLHNTPLKPDVSYYSLIWPWFLFYCLLPCFFSRCLPPSPSLSFHRSVHQRRRLTTGIIRSIHWTQESPARPLPAWRVVFPEPLERNWKDLFPKREPGVRRSGRSVGHVDRAVKSQATVGIIAVAWH